MPRKFMKRKRGRKRKFQRSLYGRKGLTSIARPLTSHFPPVLRCKLSAVCAANLDGTTAAGDSAAAFLFYRGNGIINVGPSTQAITAGTPTAYGTNFPGGLPYLLGRDATTSISNNGVVAPYARFLVLGSSITLRLSTPTTPNDNSLRVVLMPLTGDPQPLIAGISQQVHNLGEQPYARMKIIPPSITNAGGLVMKNKISSKRILGMSRYLATEDIDYTGNYSTDPVRPWTWIVGVNNLAASTLDWTIVGEAKITYDVLFYNRNMLASYAPS